MLEKISTLIIKTTIKSIENLRGMKQYKENLIFYL